MGVVLVLLVLIGLIGWMWSSQLKAKEKALRVSKEFCETHQVQWLDDTVALVYLRVIRVAGELKIVRRYTFDYVDGSMEGVPIRAQGFIELRGHQVQSKGLSQKTQKNPEDRSDNIIDLSSFRDKGQK